MSKVNEIITARIIEKLESGVAPWRKTWGSTGPTLGAHHNRLSGKAYRGINAFSTAMQGFESTEWLTFKQAKELGGSVKAGEKGTPIVYLHKGIKKDKETGLERETMALLYYTVFNLDQIEGVERKAEPTPKRSPFQAIEACENVIRDTQVRTPVSHGGNRACYYPGFDKISMPRKDSFESPEAYYATLFHELGHATGHESRLNRDSLRRIAGFGSHVYSKEELIAEMTAAFLCAETGIEDATLDNSASYLQSWIKALKGDSSLLVSAAAQAQKASEYILNKI